jgi:PRTRC genetic system protein A
MRIRDAILAEALPLPPIPPELAYQFVVAGNGLFVRAEDSRMEAMVPVVFAAVHGLETVESYARLKVPRVSGQFLAAILKSARAHLPNEAMYQFSWESRGDGEAWHCFMPFNKATPGKLDFEDRAGAVIDLHSHGALRAFFSKTDDDDEKGLRFYAVIGQVDHDFPQIAVRVGVYGYTWTVPQTTVFEGGPFVQVDPEVELVLAEEEDEHPV